MNKFYSFFLLTLAFFFSSLSANGQCENLFISEYMEGSGFNKFIEIYNPTSGAVDLSNYQVDLYPNGASEPNNTLNWPAGTMLGSGDVYVIGNPSADSLLLLLADTTSSVTFYNGDDAIVLIDTTAGEDLDIIGVVGEDPGSEWTVGSGSTKEHTIVRKSEINEGTTNWASSAVQWAVFDQNFADSLGFHNINNCDPLVNPIATFDPTSGSGTEASDRDTAFVTLADVDQAYNIVVSVSGGTATSGDDFVLVNGTGDYPVSMGQTLLAIPFQILDDGDAEADETFEITISEGTGNVTIGNGTYTFLIYDDDTPPTPPCQYPFFSEYIEGSSSNKMLEIYNPTDAAIDLGDYQINRFNNGNDGSTDTSDIFYWEPGTMLGSGEVYVIGNPSADSLLQLEADTTSTITFYNGDDALDLEVSATNMSVDIIGRIGEDPGSNWPVGEGATSEYTLVRDPSVQGGQTNWLLGAETWLIFERNFADSLGAHYMIPCGMVDPCDTTELQISGDITDESLDGENDGAINLSVSGGTGSYTYDWSGPDGFSADTEDLDNLAPGEYCVIVADGNDCEEDACFTVEAGSGPCDTITVEITGMVTDESQAGANDGAIDISVSGGVEPYEYDWSNDETSEDIDNLEPGPYSVVVTDSLGCEATEDFNVAAGSDPCDTVTISIDGDVTDESELGENDGAIDITISGGSPPYDVLWSNSSTDEDISGLAPDTYTVVVEDANGCLGDASFTVDAGTDPCDGVNIQVTVAVTNESAPGAEDGAINISVTGGTPPYTYSWNTGETTEDIDGLDGGAYDVTVEDANGCTGTANAIVGTGTGINEIAALKTFNVFPNPASDHLQIELQFDRSLKVQMSIVDLSGRIVFENSPEQVNSRIYTLNPDWPAGIYFLKIIADGDLAVEPIIISR